MTTFHEGTVSSPIGDILLIWDEKERIVALDFATHEERMRKLFGRYHPGDAGPTRTNVPPRLTKSLADYFAGNLSALDSLEVETGGSEFEREVWLSLRSIPVGETTSYGALATRLGRPGASRAVGRANGANPVSLVLPCHRVVGASGALTGYAGGLARKEWLLAHERGDAPREYTGEPSGQASLFSP